VKGTTCVHILSYISIYISICLFVFLSKSLLMFLIISYDVSSYLTELIFRYSSLNYM
jgi:hypothetical protein